MQAERILRMLDKELIMKMYRLMVLSRVTEEQMVEYHHHTPLTELPHTGIGQEAIGVGSVCALRSDDQILPSLRTRAAYFAKGVSSRVMMAGAFAKAATKTRGHNTSHHYGDPEHGVITGTAVVAGHVPVAVGVSLAAKLQHRDYVAVAYFGDGACNRGDVHEAMNMAAAMSLGTIFICENNLYAISTPVSYATHIKDFASRAVGYGMPGVIVDGNDVIAVYEATKTACERARRGDGPTFIECKTYRWRGHSERDPRDSRPPEEIAAWKKKCPILKLEKYIAENKIASQKELDDIRSSVNAEVQDAIKFAEDSPFPAPEETLLHVYAD
jgi:TPP-dependent pyruvate/acetoin dehydrogenase alpha subunit